MTPHRLRIAASLVLTAAACNARADEPSPSRFALAPASAQANPLLNLTVFTEVTKEGKAYPKVTPDHPAYYAGSFGGHQTVTDKVEDQPSSADDSFLQALAAKALADRGYLPAAAAAKPPSLLIVCTWGSLFDISAGAAHTDNRPSPEYVRNQLAHAAMIGGYGFSQKLTHLLQESGDQTDFDRMGAGARARIGSVSDNQGAAGNPFGAAPVSSMRYSVGGMVVSAETAEAMDPIEQFRNSSAQHRLVLSQVGSNLYYVVLSAYDYSFAAQRKGLLVWRTRMTVERDHVTPQQALPALLLAARPYFGQDMAEALARRDRMVGRVEIGEFKVIGFTDALPVPPLAGPPKP